MPDVDAMIAIVAADGRVNLVPLDVRRSQASPSRVSEQADVEAAPIRVSTRYTGRPR